MPRLAHQWVPRQVWWPVKGKHGGQKPAVCQRAGEVATLIPQGSQPRDSWSSWNAQRFCPQHALEDACAGHFSHRAAQWGCHLLLSGSQTWWRSMQNLQHWCAHAQVRPGCSNLSITADTCESKALRSLSRALGTCAVLCPFLVTAVCTLEATAPTVGMWANSSVFFFILACSALESSAASPWTSTGLGDSPRSVEYQSGAGTG